MVFGTVLLLHGCRYTVKLTCINLNSKGCCLFEKIWSDYALIRREIPNIFLIPFSKKHIPRKRPFSKMLIHYQQLQFPQQNSQCREKASKRNQTILLNKSSLFFISKQSPVKHWFCLLPFSKSCSSAVESLWVNDVTTCSIDLLVSWLLGSAMLINSCFTVIKQHRIVPLKIYIHTFTTWRFSANFWKFGLG